MAQNGDISDESSRGMRIGQELSPWLKRRLLEGKLRPANTSSGEPLGEHASRLMRRVMKQQQPVSKVSSKMSLSRPSITAGGGSALPPSGWQALVLLLSRSSKNMASDANPGIYRWEGESQDNISKPGRRGNRSIEQPLPDSRVAIPASSKPQAQIARMKIIRGKVEEMADRRAKQIDDNMPQTSVEQTDRGNAKSENAVTSGDSNRAVSEAQVITPKEGPISRLFTPEADGLVNQNLTHNVERAIHNSDSTAETGTHTADTGIKPGKSIKTDISSKRENPDKPVLSKKALSSGSKKRPEGTVHRYPQSLPVKSPAPQPLDSQRTDEPPEVTRRFPPVVKTFGEKITPGPVEEKSGSQSGPVFFEKIDKNIGKTKSTRVSESGKEEIVRGSGPVMPATPKRAKGQSPISGKSVSHISREEIPLRLDDKPVEDHRMNKITANQYHKEENLANFDQSAMPDIAGRINNLENPGLERKRPFADNISVSEGIISRHTQELSARKIKSNQSFSNRPKAASDNPGGALNIHSGMNISNASEFIISNIASDMDVSSSYKMHNNLNKVQRRPENTAGISSPPILNTPARLPIVTNPENLRLQKKSEDASYGNRKLEQQQASKFYPHLKSGSQAQFSGEHRITEAGAVKISEFRSGASLKMEIDGQDSGAASSRNAGLVERKPEKQLIHRQPEFRVITSPLAPSLVNHVYRSMDLPVQRSIKPAVPLTRNRQGDNNPLIPGFNGPTSLELPLAVSDRPKVDYRENADRKLSGTSSGIPRPPGTGYYSLPQQTVTYINRSAETESTWQSSAAAQQTEKGVADLKTLARDIYPYIKRMILIEKERLPNL